MPVRWSRTIWIMDFADFLGKICNHNKTKDKKTKFCVICCMHSCGLVIPYRNREIGQHGNSGLLPDHTKPLPDSKVHGAHLGPSGPRWAPYWPHEPCYLGMMPYHQQAVMAFILGHYHEKIWRYQSVNEGCISEITLRFHRSQWVNMVYKNMILCTTVHWGWT